ncbi:response regulator [Paenibacillus sp. CF384]|uniref:response regulator transcription factor n=1 Tax=Paenibacillus sp. CF384 TaxID=1884382 RepID=UPI00089B0F79|nr:response regulator [Paenibacillus sp. CF384]SDX95400.1 two-component system, response regulator YesN [Paenibacillus sp. CF384]
MSYRILLVDDEPMIKLSMRKIITDTHPDFVIVGDAMDGQEALELAEREQPHVIITDISMPVMGGLELIRAIHEKGWKPEIVILSGYGEFDYAREALRYGVADYILKPIRVSAVKELMVGLYEKHREKIECSRTKNNLMLQCLQASGGLFELIWKVDEPGVKAAAEEVVRMILSYELPDEQKKESLLDTAAAIRHQSEERGTPLAFELVWREQLPEMIQDFHDMLLHELGQVRSSRNWGKHSAISEAIAVIQARYADPQFKLDELLSVLNISVTHFYNMFKQETGKSFISYLIEYRIEQAKGLFSQQKQLKTYEVGEQVGYPDYPHFTKLFKKVVGVTPSEYRKLV